MHLLSWSNRLQPQELENSRVKDLEDSKLQDPKLEIGVEGPKSEEPGLEVEVKDSNSQPPSGTKTGDIPPNFVEADLTDIEAITLSKSSKF